MLFRSGPSELTGLRTCHLWKFTQSTMLGQRNLHPRVLIVLPTINRIFRATAFCCILLPIPCLSAEEAGSETAKASAVSFANDVEPIFSQHCYGCHQGAKQLGSYLMTDFSSLLKGGESEQAAVVPGKPDESYLFQQITPIDGHAEMPDEPFKPLSDIEREVIRNWILQGAKNDSEGERGPRFTTNNPPEIGRASCRERV